MINISITESLVTVSINGTVVTEQSISQKSESQPECKISPDGTKYWYLNNKLHRTDGPAVECADGSKSWWLNGKCHRTDGPAIEWSDGSKRWWLNGQRHRTDGPAIEFIDGSKAWYLNGEQVFPDKMIKNLTPEQKLLVNYLKSQ